MKAAIPITIRAAFSARNSRGASISPAGRLPLYHRLPEGGGVFQGFLGDTSEAVDVKPTSGRAGSQARDVLWLTPSQGDFLTPLRC